MLSSIGTFCVIVNVVDEVVSIVTDHLCQLPAVAPTPVVAVCC